MSSLSVHSRYRASTRTRSAVKREKSRRSPLRIIVLSLSAVVLIWLVASRSFTAYLADTAPQVALWFDPQQPQALVNLADQSIGAMVKPVAATLPVDEAQDQESVGPGNVTTDRKHLELNRAFATFDPNRNVDLATIRVWAEFALLRDPLNASALRLLGQVAIVTGDKADAAKFMNAAARVSLHESSAVYWLMLKSTEADDYKTAISYADALLRTNRGLAPYVVPLLGRFAEQKTSNSLVKAVLDGNPPWRDLFFTYLPSNMSDARTPLDLLLSLRTSAVPPTNKEIGDYLTFLIARKFYDLAYYTWLQFLPADELRTAGLLYNGNFEIKPSGLPFDWVITPGVGVTVDIVPVANNNDGHALLIEFLYGRVDYHSVRELVLLPPGTYQFDGQYQGKLVGPRGLKWRLICADDASMPIGESPMISGATSTWKEIKFMFTVPATNCRAQYVRLDLDARMASEQLVSGSVLINQLHISRVDITQGSQQIQNNNNN